MEQAGEQHPARTLSAALADAAKLLGTDPAMAAQRAAAILDTVPGQHQALLLQVGARLALGDMTGACAMLERAAGHLPKLAALQYELGLLLGALSRNDAAIAALSRAVELEPDHPAAWRSLGDRLAEAGRTGKAGLAYANHFRSAISDLKFLEDAAAQAQDNPALAEGMMSAFLGIHPTDVCALHGLARLFLNSGRLDEAEKLFARILELAPTFRHARQEYIHLLVARENRSEAKRQLEIILAEEPQRTENRALKAAMLVLTGEYDQAIEDYEALLRDHPGDDRLWISAAYGHRSAGRRDDSIAAYRRAATLRPQAGHAWWGLANLKTFEFAPADVDTMRAQLERDLGDEDRYLIHFALGKALEDRKKYADSFENYRLGNLIRRAEMHYDPDDMTTLVRHSRAVFTRDFFRAREGWGCLAPDPVFIVGLPRSGSTLIEQILSSHSAVEGTAELPELISLSIRLAAEKGCSGESGYLEVLPSLDRKEVERLGESYLEGTRPHRKLGTPFFTDKMPNNFHHLGLLHLILPNAKIIDARRHPLACCFSNYKQYFSSRPGPSYDMGDLGRYYRDYVELMAHFDDVLPGRVLRVSYETVVCHPDDEIRRLLAWCNLPFEESCLRFHQSNRGVLTASSEQVRQPIYSDGIDQWRHYEPWLGPLKTALGSAIEDYPVASDTRRAMADDERPTRTP